MDKANIFNQMAQYDFSNPIQVTMIFEEDNDEMTYNINTLKEQNQNKSQKGTQKNCLEELNAKTHAVMNIDLTEEERTCEDILYSSNAKGTTQVTSPLDPIDRITNVRAQKAKKNVDSNKNIFNAYPEETNNSPQSALPNFIKHLLHTVSQHIILIMRPYYNYYCRNNNAMDINLEKRMNKIKAHFFNLSYSTVVSVILPQEKNELFMNKLFDKTVCDANVIFKWKCERRHVEPFYKEMIDWTKQKKEQLKSLNLKDHSMQHSFGPPLQWDGSKGSEKSTDLINGAQHNNEGIDDSEKGMCIFSSGEPGNEISINIASETLINHFIKQPTNCTKPVNNRQTNKHLNPLNTQPTSIQDHNDAVPGYFQQKSYSQRNTIHHKTLNPRPPPPPYSNQSHTATALNRLHSSVYSANWIQQNPVQNYQSPQTRFPFTVERRQYDSQIEEQTFLPSITSITSQTPPTLPQIGRCCVCGNETFLKCAKCNNISYCSVLCQELDVGIHKSI